STLKREVVEGVDLLIVRELTGGIYFGKPRGISKEGEEEVGINTEIYRTSEIRRIAKDGFEADRKRRRRLTSIANTNVLELSHIWRHYFRSNAITWNYSNLLLHCDCPSRR